MSIRIFFVSIVRAHARHATPNAESNRDCSLRTDNQTRHRPTSPFSEFNEMDDMTIIFYSHSFHLLYVSSCSFFFSPALPPTMRPVQAACISFVVVICIKHIINNFQVFERLAQVGSFNFVERIARPSVILRLIVLN